MEYVFVAVNYNGYEHTKKFINSINAISIENNDSIQIIIVDNSSSDEDIQKNEVFIDNIENVFLVKSIKNLGYFGGINLGLNEIENKKTKTILICNNDLTFDKDFINNYQQISYDSNIFLLAPNIITKEGRQQNPHVVSKVSKYEIFKSDIYFSNYYVGMIFKLIFNLLKNFKKQEKNLTNNYNQVVIKRGIGACYILTEHFFDKFDNLDNKVFLWGEEAVLTNQIEEYDGKTLYVPSLKIIHHESASVSIIQSRKKYDILKKSYKIYRKYL